MAHIVLDKSYLQGASPDKIISLCDEHTVMMPDVLFYELTTTKEDSMRDCFNKFPDRDNPVELIPNIGSLLKYEWEMHKSCVPLYERRERITFRFNRRLRAGRYQFQGKQLKAKESEMQVVDNKTREFFDLAMIAQDTFYPHLSNLQGVDYSNAINDIKERISTNNEEVCGIYRRMFTGNVEHKPPIKSSDLNSNWATFRWVQVRMIYSLDLLLRYKGQLPTQPTQKFWCRIEHEMLDAEYVMLGSLALGLASNDTGLVSCYKRICPEGELLTISGES